MRQEKKSGWGKKLVIIFAVVLLALVIVVSYGLFLEPNWIQLETVELNLSRLPSSFGRLKIVYLVDLHLRKLGLREKRAIELSNALEPHMVFIGGDLVEKKGDFPLAQEFLSQLRASVGKWAVRGNWEVHLNFREGWLATRLAQAGVKLLVNQYELVRVPGGTIKIAGIDDLVIGRPDLEKTVGREAAADIVVLLAHEPVVLDSIGDHKVDLILAGHSHGGQISIPGIKPSWLPRGVGRYIKGDFKRGNTLMHVSRGLGTSAFPVRIGSPPEVTLVKLVGDAK